jgi:hypothetical protein
MPPPPRTLRAFVSHVLPGVPLDDVVDTLQSNGIIDPRQLAKLVKDDLAEVGIPKLQALALIRVAGELPAVYDPKLQELHKYLEGAANTGQEFWRMSQISYHGPGNPMTLSHCAEMANDARENLERLIENAKKLDGGQAFDSGRTLSPRGETPFSMQGTPPPQRFREPSIQVAEESYYTRTSPEVFGGGSPRSAGPADDTQKRSREPSPEPTERKVARGNDS